MIFKALSILFISGCSLLFNGAKETESAKSKFYNIEFESSGWKAIKNNDRSDYAFENKKSGSYLLSNSFCHEFQSQDLAELAKDTFKAMNKFKILHREFLKFGMRESYRLYGTGEVDGVKVSLLLQNLKRNHCYYDFILISSELNKEKELTIFENFLSSVKFK